MPKLTFFIGKGGVGKTTLSAAYAVAEALRVQAERDSSARKKKSKVLVMSTDPAHSLADIFETKMGDSPQQIRLHSRSATSKSAEAKLYAWQINAEKQFHEFLAPYKDAVLQVIESGTIFSREEIEPLLNTTLPGMAEVAALLAIHELLHPAKAGRNEYDHIVVDTAPIGHTLRLFELPEHFSRFLDFLELAGSRDRWLAQRFGGSGGLSNAFLEQWQQIVGEIKDVLSAEQSELYMVTSAEEFSLNEAARSAKQLRAAAPRLRVDGIVLNRVVSSASAKCKRCGERAKKTAAAEAFLKRNFRNVPVLKGEDPGFPILGVSALATFGEQVFGGAKSSKRATSGVRKANRKSAGGVEAKLKQVQWPKLATPLTFTVGKGGVGKTTVSAALGFHQRSTNAQEAVTVCSTDPAPSLDDVFQAEVTGKARSVLGDAKLKAIEIDSVAEFREWAERMQEKINRALSSSGEGGIHVDLSFDRRIFVALLNIVPPGVDEIFAIFKILELATEKNSVAIIDMAPTGHALELLRMPERMLLWTRLLLKSLAAHRTLPIAQDVAVEIASVGQQIRELVKILQDGARSRVMAVMLPEPLPGEETARLIAAVEQLSASVGAVFVNRVLTKEETRGCPRCKSTREWQKITLRKIEKRYSDRSIYLIEDFGKEVAGKTGLRDFTKKLWQFA